MWLTTSGPIWPHKLLDVLHDEDHNDRPDQTASERVTTHTSASVGTDGLLGLGQAASNGSTLKSQDGVRHSVVESLIRGVAQVKTPAACHDLY